ncbi:MAG TPA: replication factor C large subunit [Alphaproteobacteria bacterium]|nr:replication factor C large subunit [Alphaproteobacteria bacterium]
MPFTHKYKPKKISEIIGQSKALDEVKQKISEYSSKKVKKALLLYGPSGTGKTATIHALAEELDLELIEVNASDTRNSAGLEEKIFPAIKQQSLFGRSKIILIDEIDGISGTSDRGGVSTLVKLIEQSPFPIILTANDPFEQKFSDLRKSSVLIEFKAISTLEQASLLKKVCEKEGITFDEDALSQISRSSNGDLRAALTDLENICSVSKHVTRKDVEATSDRERADTIEAALLKVFKTTNPEIAISAFDKIEEDVDKLFLWLDENITKEYTKPKDISRAYDNIALADVFFGRIRKWQYYRYYVYIYNLLSVGIAISKDERNPEVIQYKQSERILKIWIANQKNAKRKAIAAKIAAENHVSIKETIKSMAFLRIIFKNADKKFVEANAEKFKLEKEEIEWLTR